MSLADDAQLRRLAPNEQEHLFAFYRETLKSAERVIALYRWRLEDPDSSGGIDTYVAEEGGRFMGAMSLVPTRLSCNGRLFEAAWYADSIVHPDARGRGIGSRLLSFTAAEAPITLAKGTVEPMYRLRKRAGFVDVPRDTFLLRAMTPLPRGERVSFKRRTMFPALWLAGRISTRLPSQLDTVEIDRFDAGFDHLADALAQAPNLRFYKPSGYLNWRYFTCPIRRYRVFAALREGEPAGAVILRTAPRPGTDAWIVDLVLDESDGQVAHSLLNVAFEKLGRSRASAVRTFVTCPRLRRLLRLRGFFSASNTPHFTYHLTPDARLPRSYAWSFFHGDCDTELVD